MRAWRRRISNTWSATGKNFGARKTRPRDTSVADEGEHFLDGLFEGRGFGDLGADVHLDAAQAEVFEAGGAGVDGGDLFKGDAEFIFVGAGGDFGVGVGGDVGVDAQGDGRNFLQAGGDAVDALQFRFALAVEGVNVLPQGEFNFLFRLAHAGEDAAARVAAGGDDALQVAGADDVEAAAGIGEHAEHGEVRVGFDGVANQVVHRRQRGIQLLEMVGQRVLGIDVKRRAEFFGERVNAHTFTE